MHAPAPLPVAGVARVAKAVAAGEGDALKNGLQTLVPNTEHPRVFRLIIHSVSAVKCFTAAQMTPH